MSNFKLIIQFSESDTKKINSEGAVLAIVKGHHADETDPAPIWVALSPFDKNTITWKSVYGLYASPNPVQAETDNGTTIIISETAALTVNMSDNPTQTIHYNGTEFVLGPIT